MANVTRWDPFEDVDDLFKGFFLRPMRMEPQGETPVRAQDGREGERQGLSSSTPRSRA